MLVKLNGETKKTYDDTFKSKRRPVFQFEEDGTFVNSYNNAREASEVTGIPTRDIISSCNSKEKSKIISGGFKWKYERDV